MHVHAQSNFEGKIKYNITYQGITESQKGYASMLSNSSTTYFKGSKIRVEIPGIIGSSIAIILDRNSLSGYMLMDVLGSKTAEEITHEGMFTEADVLSKLKFTYLDEYKTIAGYKCQKAILKTTDSSSMVMEVYFTEKMPNLTWYFTPGLKGLALQYTTDAYGMKFATSTFRPTVTASAVIEEKIPDTLFEVPEGYEIEPSQKPEQTDDNQNK